MRIEPDWLLRHNTGTAWREYREPQLTRRNVEDALCTRLADFCLESRRDVTLTGRDGPRLIAQSGCWADSFDLVVDATGAHRATLPMIADFAPPVRWQDEGPVMLYQTVEFATCQDLPRVHWSSAAVNGALGALYGEADGSRLRLTASRDQSAARIESRADIAQVYGDRIAAQFPQDAEVINRTSTVAPQYRRLLLTDPPLTGWLTLGDAAMQWPPRLGTGVRALFRQCRQLHDTITGGGTAAEVQADLGALMRQMWEERAQDLALRA